MRVNPKYIEVLGDTIIPLLGYFLWEWSLYFIVLYFIFELIFSEGFMYLKYYKSHAFQASKRGWFIPATLGFVALSTLIILIHLGFIFLIPTIDFKTQISLFLSYEDMGIAQGFIIFPLLFISGYQRYKLEFIRLNKHETLSVQQLWRTQWVKYIFVLLLIGFCALMLLIGINNSLTYLVIILLASASFKVLSKPI
jgi:hypothetical protein